MYELHSVTQIYEHRGNVVTALDNCNLEIPDNDFISIVGPSGSGKTTLLSILSGMMAPLSGSVFLGGLPLYELPVDERTKLRGEKIGFVFQSFNLVKWLSVCENVQISLMFSGEPAGEQRARALELLDRVGLSSRADHLPTELTQGQQHLVALARTLSNDPRVILVDQPTRNLDPRTRKQVMNSLSQFHEDGRTIVIATHDADTAAIAQRTILMVDGVYQEVAVKSAA
ncbi:MAG: ABC transporter ATP-binding protein [Planctomycetaceae bacterium]|nr:ABC transporter ATP-binding protein [Planctomycetaceae bacterium]